jgi:SEC-C motif-containing protein
MRARYAAHVLQLVDFIVATHHPSTKHEIDLPGLLSWLQTTKWLRLEVKGGQKGGVEDKKGKVRFMAYYEDANGKQQMHHELSTFQKEGKQWYFVKGETPPSKFVLKRK